VATLDARAVTALRDNPVYHVEKSDLTRFGVVHLRFSGHAFARCWHDPPRHNHEPIGGALY
jgi:hypothetical protein